MWKGMSEARKPRHAAGAAIFQVLVVALVVLDPGSIGGGCLREAAFADSFGGALVFWFVVGAVVDGISWAIASSCRQS